MINLTRVLICYAIMLSTRQNFYKIPLRVAQHLNTASKWLLYFGGICPHAVVEHPNQGLQVPLSTLSSLLYVLTRHLFGLVCVVSLIM